MVVVHTPLVPRLRFLGEATVDIQLQLPTIGDYRSELRQNISRSRVFRAGFNPSHTSFSAPVCGGVMQRKRGLAAGQSPTLAHCIPTAMNALNHTVWTRNSFEEISKVTSSSWPFRGIPWRTRGKTWHRRPSACRQRFSRRRRHSRHSTWHNIRRHEPTSYFVVRRTSRTIYSSQHNPRSKACMRSVPSSRR